MSRDRHCELPVVIARHVDPLWRAALISDDALEVG
jgi:hypothetical protein